jgi:phosphate transport system substrate-binding protein
MKRFSLIFMFVLLVLATSGCGKSGAGKQGDTQVIRIAGSTSMMPLSEKLAGAYQKKNPNVKIHIEGGDSSLGIQGVIRGIADIGSVSRPLTAEENKVLKVYKIAGDSICVIVNDKNPVRKLTASQLREVFSGNISNWSQIGGLNKPVTVINRERGSGTYHVFQDMVMAMEEKPDSKALVMTSTGSVLSTVMRDVSAIGYVSSGCRAEGVKRVEIHTGENKAFELSRPLAYVVSPQAGGLVHDFLAFCTGEEGTGIIKNHQDN